MLLALKGISNDLAVYTWDIYTYMIQNIRIIGISRSLLIHIVLSEIDSNIMRKGKRNVRARKYGVLLASILFINLMRDNDTCIYVKLT